MSRLLVISPTLAASRDGKLFLDKKFVEGMRFYSDRWPGPVGCLLHERTGTFAFGQYYDPAELPFKVELLPEGRALGPREIAGYDTILCGGDGQAHLHLAETCRRTGQALVFVIENIDETRRQMVMLDRTRSWPRRARALASIQSGRRRRRQAFQAAGGIQANGHPAFAAYSPMNPDTMMFYDSRVSEDLLATDADMAARSGRLATGAPLRLMHSGRLEPLKGSQDLIPIARRLTARGIAFELDIFGTGSLEAEIAAGIAAHGLQGKVRLNGPVDFRTELMPFARTRADIYLSCHRQSDPSCTYLENMGCGLAVVGYANRMWAALCEVSGAGWTAPLGKPEALAEALAEAATDRARLAACCTAARDFAAAHSFEREFDRRIAHLQAVGRPGRGKTQSDRTLGEPVG
ncbi:group 1 glycosyl transferase [Oceaniovalibus guishaninsula JLT2003]|uniref:Group 1 glycosyl transferase n=1 Tax=Oceaniovalibus guishaninsula JLT2003 TaxID=1231392 RepID=K2HAE7_9RHOB|nr:glycosyltransferase [Oceaniovalibus guishaninsula]EKE44503.1 group 1 glycosyl transferase [Oceaniovalibus guishaninsula JLT2003]